MPKNQEKNQVKLLSKPFGFAADGHSIAISGNGNVELVFFQVVLPKQGDTLEANGIATIRMNQQQLTTLRDSITSTLETHEKKAEKISKSKGQ